MAKPRTEKIFARIYAKNAWGNAESRSGIGSKVARTELLRPRLTKLLLDLGVRSLLDLPCGDFNWMRLTELPGIEYTGADIVTPLIEKNNLLNAQPGRRFLRLDMLCDTVPKADLVLYRDGLVHLSFFDIAQALKRMHDGGTTYLLTTTFTAHRRNKDTATRGWRPLNLVLAPFCFPDPLQTLRDARPDGTAPDKTWRCITLPTSPTVCESCKVQPGRIQLPEALRRGAVESEQRLGERSGDQAHAIPFSENAPGKINQRSTDQHKVAHNRKVLDMANKKRNTAACFEVGYVSSSFLHGADDWYPAPPR